MTTTDVRTAPTPGNTSPRARAVRLMELAASMVTVADVQQWLSFDSAVIQKAWELVDPTVVLTPSRHLDGENLELTSRTPAPGTAQAVENIAKYADPANHHFILVVAELAKVRLAGNESCYEVSAYTRRGVCNFVTENLAKADGMSWMVKALMHTRVLLFVEVRPATGTTETKRIIRRVKPLSQGALSRELRKRTLNPHGQ